MRIIRNNIIPFKGFAAINLMGVLFVRKGIEINEALINHERIHTYQMKELGYVGFYLLYILEWLMRLLMPGNAYRNLSFEKEAYKNQYNPNYLLTRRHFAQWRKGI